MMEQKILKKLEETANKINELGVEREKLVKDIRNIDMNMEILTTLIYELKSLLESKEE